MSAFGHGITPARPSSASLGTLTGDDKVEVDYEPLDAYRPLVYLGADINDTQGKVLVVARAQLCNSGKSSAE